MQSVDQVQSADKLLTHSLILIKTLPTNRGIPPSRFNYASTSPVIVAELQINDRPLLKSVSFSNQSPVK